MTVSVPGAELFYSTRGHGPVCLVLSSIGTKPYERMTPPQLSDRLRLVYVDLRGSGRSTGTPPDLTFDVLAHDLEAVRVDLGAERVVVLGHSILGALAIEYGRRCPGAVSHVIVVGMPPSGSMTDLAGRAASFFEADASEERKQVLRENLARLPADASPGQAMLARSPQRFYDPRVDAAPIFAEAEVKWPFLAHLMGPLTSGWDVTAGAESLQVPTLVAHGRFDYTVPYVLWTDILPKLPRATMRVFEKSGHQPFFEEPDAFAAAVTDWMAHAG